MTPAGAEESWDHPPKKKCVGQQLLALSRAPLVPAGCSIAGGCRAAALLSPAWEGGPGLQGPPGTVGDATGLRPHPAGGTLQGRALGGQPALAAPSCPAVPLGQCSLGWRVGGQRPPSCEAAWVTSAALFALGHRTTALLSSWCRWPQRAGCPGAVLGMWGCLWQQDSLVLRACTRAFGA